LEKLFLGVFLEIEKSLEFVELFIEISVQFGDAVEVPPPKFTPEAFRALKPVPSGIQLAASRLANSNNANYSTI
jgi:hypothetical protein